jgi:hypothetical protein
VRGILRPRRFVRRYDELDVFGGIFVKIFLAVFAAEFDFAIFVGKHVRLAHFAQLVAGKGAGGQLVRLRSGGGSPARPATGAANAEIERAIAAKFLIVFIASNPFIQLS